MAFKFKLNFNFYNYNQFVIIKEMAEENKESNYTLT